MTVTPTHRAAPRRRLRMLLTAVIAAAMLVPLAALPAAGATEPTPTPSPPPTGIVAFTMSPVGNGIVRAGDALTVSATVQNGTDADTAPSGVSLSLGSSPISDRQALTRWLAGEGTDSPMDVVATASFPGVAAQGEDTIGVMVEAASPVLAGRPAGVYPLLATYDGPRGTISSTSAMIVPDDEAAPTGIGVIVPITAGPRADGLLTPAELTLLTAPDGSLANLLDAVENTPAILAIDPAIPAAIRVLGTRAPASAVDWLERLENLPNSRFALQFGDADVSVQLAAGSSRPARPTSLRYAMQPAGFPPAEPTPAPTPTQTPPTDSSGALFPALAELVDVGGETSGVFWPAPGTTSAAIVESLGAITVDDSPSLTLVPSTATAAGASGATVSAHRTTGEAGVLVYDDAISRILLEGSQLDDSVLRGAPRAAATAYLAFAAKDAGGAPLLVTVDRAVDRSRIALATTLMTAFDAPGLTPVPLDSLATATPSAVELVEGRVDPERTSAASAFFEEEAAIARFATILDDASLLTGPERAQVLQLLGVGWLSDPPAWSTAVQAHRAQTTATLHGVGLIPVGDIQQIGPSADIPIWVRNDLSYDVSVVLSSTPSDLRLDVQRSTPITARAQSNTRVLIPVNAQLGSGEVEISLQLRSRTLEPIGGSQVAKVTVRADWERYGVIALISVVGLLLVVGVIRTIRRRRGARRADAPDAADALDASHTPDASGAPEDPGPAGVAAAAEGAPPAADAPPATDAPPAEGAPREAHPGPHA